MYPEKLLDLTMELIAARPASISGKWCVIFKNGLPVVIAWEHRTHLDQILLTFGEVEALQGLNSKQWNTLTGKLAELWEPERNHL